MQSQIVKGNFGVSFMQVLNYTSFLMWSGLLMVKYVLTMLNIGFTKNNAE